jgi:hypothetical protein
MIKHTLKAMFMEKIHDHLVRYTRFKLDGIDEKIVIELT